MFNRLIVVMFTSSFITDMISGNIKITLFVSIISQGGSYTVHPIGKEEDAAS